MFLETGVESEGDTDSLGAGVQMPHARDEQVGIGIVAGASAEVKAEAGTKAGLPAFDPCSPISPESPDGAWLKVQLAWLQLEAQEKKHKHARLSWICSWKSAGLRQRNRLRCGSWSWRL